MFVVWVGGWRIEADTGGPIVEASEERCCGRFCSKISEHHGGWFGDSAYVLVVVMFLIEGGDDCHVFCSGWHFTCAHNSLRCIIILIPGDWLIECDAHGGEEGAES